MYGQEEIMWNVSASHPSICQEDFFCQHFVGKRFVYDPSVPKHYAVFDDGTGVRTVSSEYGEPCDMLMAEQQGTGVIAKAYFDIDEYSDSNTYSLYVEYEGDPTPHLIAQETFSYEASGITMRSASSFSTKTISEEEKK